MLYKNLLKYKKIAPNISYKSSTEDVFCFGDVLHCLLFTSFEETQLKKNQKYYIKSLI